MLLPHSVCERQKQLQLTHTASIASIQGSHAAVCAKTALLTKLTSRMNTPHITIIGRNEHHTVTIETPGTYEVFLNGEGAEATIKGVFAVAGTETAEVILIIRHQAPNTLSKTLLKGVARDKARISFTGRIIVEEDCHNTNAFLTERILLLSDTATAEAIPELEILTDDVKCSHAASVSYIPESQLFYLMSRGIPRSTAEELIVAGFLEQAQ